jgi:hypothetical protein
LQDATTWHDFVPKRSAKLRQATERYREDYSRYLVGRDRDSFTSRNGRRTLPGEKIAGVGKDPEVQAQRR